MLTRSKSLVRGFTALAVIVGYLMLGAAGAPAAHAAAYYSSTVAPRVDLRPCVDLANRNCSPVGTTGTSTSAKMECWRDGSTWTGRYTSPRYFLLELSNGQEGYVHSSFVDRQTIVPHCATLPRVRAADWAIGQLGNVYAPSAYRSAPYDWSPGPRGEWSGDCAKLPYIAYTATGSSYRLANAIDQWNYYRSHGLTRAGIPRYGDPVFWNETRWGHTAIYIGGTTVVGTVGLDGYHRPVSTYGLYSHPNYLGWAKVTAP